MRAADDDAQRRHRFEELVALVFEPLQRYLRRRADPATADDVLGDVLLVLWRRLDDVPAELPLPYAYGVARGCLANSRRGAARQERLVRRLAQAAPTRHDHDDGPDDGSDDAALAEALEALPDADRFRAKQKLEHLLAPRKDADPAGRPRSRRRGGAAR